MKYEQLRLDNQLCFPVYAASRLITREYQPYLDELGITYPQYLVLMILWESDNMPVNQIAQKLVLNTNTVTPLLKRLENQGLIERKRSEDDERKVMIRLTGSGRDLQERASDIPEKLASGLISGKMQLPELVALKQGLHHIIEFLSAKQVTAH
jgi:DNA-binding MarR family transcriptional regulator